MSLVHAAPQRPNLAPPRHDWTRAEVKALFALPFPELMFCAATAHRENFDPAEVQISTLLSIKTGGCPEDCAYCPQAARYDTGVKAEKLMSLEAVLGEARAAKAGGASRFCMGAAWRSPKDRELDQVCAMVEGVKALGLETCATLGMLTGDQAQRLKQSGLDYYNHNLDTSPEYYGAIITTRTYEDRLDTLAHVRAAGIHVCCGGIVGMGERIEAVFIGARGDDGAIIFRRGVEVVVVVVKSGLLEALRLIAGQHAERGAGLQAERLDAFHHGANLVELAVLGRTPGRAHAETRGAAGLGGTRFAEHRLEAHEFCGFHAGVVTRRLRAIGAILRATTGLDRQQGRDLYFGGIEILTMSRCGAKHQLRERQCKQGFHLGARPVVTRRG